MLLWHEAGKLSYSRTTGMKKKLWSASCSANIPFVNSQKSNTVCGIFTFFWMTFSCRRGVSMSVLIHESTSLPGVTDLSISPGLAQGGLSGLPGVSNGTSLSACVCVCVCVLRKHTGLIPYCPFTAASSCKQHSHCVYLCVITGCNFPLSLK